jgi:hypothetical protein
MTPVVAKVSALSSCLDAEIRSNGRMLVAALVVFARRAFGRNEAEEAAWRRLKDHKCTFRDALVAELALDGVDPSVAIPESLLEGAKFYRALGFEELEGLFLNRAGGHVRALARVLRCDRATARRRLRKSV